MASRGVNDVLEIARQIDPGGKPRKAGRGYIAVRCPAHEDNTPSLTVWYDTKGKLSFNCHAGCTHDAICAALPKSVLDHAWETWGTPTASVLPMPFRPTPPVNPANDKIEAEYPYTNAEGELLYVVRRYPGKKIRQYHPDTDGTLQPGRPDTLPLVPYRLTDIIRAVNAGEPIWIVEGEKDADLLATHGQASTTNIGGAGKWTDNLNQWFQGATVNIIGDNDDPGRAHAEHIRQTLTGTAQTVRIVELPGLPDKGDLTDWMNAGGTIEELHQLANTEEPPGKLFGRFLDFATGDLAHLPQPRTLLGPWFQQAGVNIVFGRGGTYKSFVVQSAAASMTTGHPWGHFAVNEPQTVVYWAAEGRSGLHNRFTAWMAHSGQQIPEGALLVPETWPRLDDPALGPFMLEELRRVGCTFLVIDTLNRTKGRLKENDSDDLGTTLFDTITPALEQGIGVAIVHHSGWNTGHTRGSSALFDNADQVYKVVRDGDTVTLHDEKGKDNAERPALYFDVTPIGTSLVLEPRPDKPLTENEQIILQALEHGGWMTTPEIEHTTGISKSTIHDLAGSLRGRWVEIEPGSGRKPARWRTLAHGTQQEAETVIF